MRTIGVVFGGTGAPDGSKYTIYRPIIKVLEKSCDEVIFEAIPNRGTHAVRESVEHFIALYPPRPDVAYIFVGHSQGGYIASFMAMAMPEHTLAVIALATPYRGTSWADPVNMPVRAAVELVSMLSSGRVKLRPGLRRYVIPVLPIVGDLSAHSDINEELTQYLLTQESKFLTHAFIGNKDIAVFPHRSANPEGPNVRNYIVIPASEYKKLQPRLPEGLTHIDSKAGHMTILFNPQVHEQIGRIVADATSSSAELT